MLVNLNDGCCRNCGGQLEVVDADDATMTVYCSLCKEESYKVEPDAFGDGCINYYVPFLASQEAETECWKGGAF